MAFVSKGQLIKTVPGWYPVVVVPALITKFYTDNPVPKLKGKLCSLPDLPKPLKPPRSNSSFKPSGLIHSTTNFRYTWVLLIWLASVAVVVLINSTLGMSAVSMFGSLAYSTLFSVCLTCYLYLSHQQRLDRKRPVRQLVKQSVQQKHQLLEHEQRQALALQSQVDEKKYRQELLNRQSRLKALLLGRVQLPVSQSTAQQGVSEWAFYQCLLQYFPQASQGAEFPIPDSTLKYSADFILHHKATGLAFEIEVDEPYVGDTGQPHHCSDDPRDNRRNQFFQSRNWVVIRFAEWQVANHPISCCKLIASVIAQITGNDSILDAFGSISDLPPHKQWTTKEAKRMAKRKYRDTYLQANRSFASRK